MTGPDRQTWDNPAEDFAFYREALGLTQTELAALLRVDARTVRRWEAGARAVPGPVRALIEALLDGWRPSGQAPSTSST